MRDVSDRELSVIDEEELDKYEASVERSSKSVSGSASSVTKCLKTLSLKTPSKRMKALSVADVLERQYPFTSPLGLTPVMEELEGLDLGTNSQEAGLF